MKRFQSSIAIVGILFAVCVFVGCGNDDDDNDDSDVIIEETPPPPPPTKIVFSSAIQAEEGAFVPSDISVMDADGSNVINLTNSPDISDRHPDWSPDGDRIVFTSNIDKTTPSDIFIMNADGTNKVRLTTHRDFDFEPAWSPDGNRIAFVSVRLVNDFGFNEKIFVMDANGGNLVNLTNEPFNDRSPDWSPDGNQIVFSSIRDRKPDGNLDNTKSDIFTMNADGTNVIQLTETPARDLNPNWSPNGDQIVFEVNREPASEVYVMNTDGTNQTNLTNHPDADGDPAWSSNAGQRLPLSRTAREIGTSIR